MLFKLRRKNRSVDEITAVLAGVWISPTVIYRVVPVLKNDRSSNGGERGKSDPIAEARELSEAPPL